MERMEERKETLRLRLSENGKNQSQNGSEDGLRRRGIGRYSQVRKLVRMNELSVQP